MIRAATRLSLLAGTGLFLASPAPADEAGARCDALRSDAEIRPGLLGSRRMTISGTSRTFRVRRIDDAAR